MAAHGGPARSLPTVNIEGTPSDLHVSPGRENAMNTQLFPFVSMAPAPIPTGRP